MSRYALLAVAAVGIVSTSAAATPLNLTLQSPDFSSFFVSTSYNATTDVLTASGVALSLDLDDIAPPDFNITSGTFNLTANINASGNLLPGGSFSIGGSIPGLGLTGPLLVGTATAFGFSSSPLTQIFEFRIAITGGSAANLFPGEAGIILNLGNGFNGSFNTNFASSGNGNSDTGRIIPAPGAAGAFALGLVGFAARRRRA